LPSRTAALIAILAAAGVVAALLIIAPWSRQDQKVTSREPGAMARRLDQLRSLPYTSMTADRVDTSLVGVVTYLPDLAGKGYNLYGAAQAGKVVLMDMTGKTVHQWSDPREKPASLGLPLLLPNGDVIAIQRFRGLLRLDWNSNVVWAKTERAHHELTAVDDSTFYTLEAPKEQYRSLIVRFDNIVRCNLDGRVIERWSTLENLDEIKRALDQRSFLDTILDSLQGAGASRIDPHDVPERLHPEAATRGSPVFDYFHTNTVSILPETALGRADSRFRAGNLLVCFRNANQIAVLDRQTKAIQWAWGEGVLEWPHDPTMLENGNILIYDNGVERKYTRILELNPLTETIEWTYGEAPDQRFFSRSRGSCQRLSNGNTLICDSDSGRAFEVTRSGQIVWDWLNPYITKGHRGQVYRMIRLDPEVVEPLLARLAPS
jgi:hypothetical protein